MDMKNNAMADMGRMVKNMETGKKQWQSLTV